MTAAEMTIELSKDHSMENAREIAAELAEIAAKKRARAPKKDAKPAKAAKKAKKAVKPAKTVKPATTAKKAAKPAEKKDGPTAWILALVGRRNGGATTGEIHELFPTTKKSDILTRLSRQGRIVRVGPGQWMIAPKRSIVMRSMVSAGLAG
jgi:hypothetical protein